MASVFKKRTTRPLPEGAEIITRKDERVARWKLRNGKTRTAPVTAGKDGTRRITIVAAKYAAQYRDGAEALEARDIDLNALFREVADRRSGKTLYAVAAELGASQSTLTRPYNGERVPPLELVCRVATVAGHRVEVELTMATSH